MKIHLVGFGDPIPEEALPDPGESGDVRPLLLNLPNGAIFLKDDYLSFGYTNFEVTCIGACGGKGGRTVYGTATAGIQTSRFAWGGGGGGGGLHVVSGLLGDLPESCEIVVGQAGADGAWGTSPAGDVMDPGDPGQDGGASSFNIDICMASGGKGGGPTTSVPADIDGPGGAGGQGGIGGQLVAGGGAFTEDQGSWDGTIGEGGGGGIGGSYIENLTFGIHELYPATSGGNGSFAYGDTSRYGPRETYSVYVPINKPIIPGTGGGAKQSPTAIFGGRSVGANPNGVVFIRLTKII